MEKSKKIINTFVTTKNFYTIGPFTTTSDRLVPIYPDSRKVFSDPAKLKIIAKEIKKFVQSRKIKFDIIFGGASAGIQPATALGLLMNKPTGFVRKEAKGGGLGLAVEGNYEPGMTALLIDDALGHGAAKVKFIRNIRKTGLKINWAIVIISRSNRHPKYLKWVKKSKIKFQSFGDIYDIIEESYKRGDITKEAYILLKWYGDDAKGWYKDKKKWQFFLNYKKMKKRNSKTGV